MGGLQFWESNIFRLGFCQRGRGRSFHADGLKTEKVEPTVNSLVQGIWSIYNLSEYTVIDLHI